MLIRLDQHETICVLTNVWLASLIQAVYRNFHEAARVMAFSYPRLVLEADKKGRLPVDLIPLGKGRKLLRQAVDLEAAMAIVKQRQEAFVMEVTEEEEKRKQEKTAASLRAADVAAKRRREALVNKSAGLGGSFLKVQQLDEVPDEFAMLDAESQEDDKVLIHSLPKSWANSAVFLLRPWCCIARLVGWVVAYSTHQHRKQTAVFL